MDLKCDVQLRNTFKRRLTPWNHEVSLSPQGSSYEFNVNLLSAILLKLIADVNVVLPFPLSLCSVPLHMMLLKSLETIVTLKYRQESEELSHESPALGNLSPHRQWSFTFWLSLSNFPNLCIMCEKDFFFFLKKEWSSGNNFPSVFKTGDWFFFQTIFQIPSLFSILTSALKVKVSLLNLLEQQFSTLAAQ